MKYFVLSDVHNNYNYMLTALTEKGFDSNNENHKIILVGDAFDKGPNPVDVYLFLKEMISKNKLIWIVGNHEFLLLKRIEENKFNNHNDTYDTLNLLAKYNSKKEYLTDEEVLKEINKMEFKSFLLNNLLPYYETPNYVFAHGFIPTKKNTIIDNWRTLPLNSWYTATTNNGMKKVMVEGITIPNKTLVCGHTRASYGNVRKEYDISKWNDKIFDKLQKFKNNIEMFKPYIGNKVIGIDGCWRETKMVNCIIIED